MYISIACWFERVKSAWKIIKFIALHVPKMVELVCLPYRDNCIMTDSIPVYASREAQLEAEWSEKNGVPFEEVTVGSGKRYLWICAGGHEWEARVPDRMKKKQGCPVCSNRKVVPGYNDLSTSYPELAAMWDFKGNSNLEPTMITRGSSRKIKWVCLLGHRWQSAPKEYKIGRETFCPYCLNSKVLEGFNDLQTVNPEIAMEWHPTKNGKVTPKDFTEGSNKRAWWQCDKGHEWEADISKRRKRGCPYCSNKAIWVGDNDLATTHPELSTQWHESNTVSSSQVTYGSDVKILWRCNKGHEWETLVYLRTAKLARGCPTCAKGLNSRAEKEIVTWLKEILLPLDVIENTKTLIAPLEVDIYVPDKNIAIEYNGIYWHTESQGKDKWYHHNKWKTCKDKGIQLIQIWEDEWLQNPELIKRMLAYKLGVSSSQKIYARNCTVVTVTKEEADSFLNENHIQGSVDGSLRYGLKSGDVLLAVMILKQELDGKKIALNLLRFATSLSVPGGFSKLLNHVQDTVPAVERIVTFSDNCVSDGQLYEQNHFVLERHLPPDYKYVVNRKRKHKFSYRLRKFRTDPGLHFREGYTEEKLAALNGMERIWDAGKIKWVLELTTNTEED